MRDGLPIANEWDFEARLIADALLAVGSGSSYREAAQGMRMSARRYAMQNGVPVVSPWGRYRGAASRQKPTDRERLRQIRAAWGDYDEPQTPIVTTATIGALALSLDEDF